ncbi:MAG: ATP-binding protein [Acidimicrobiia bacterium]|nr:ATP-binding protein [Acidimicrobiia bacterium]
MTPAASAPLASPLDPADDRPGGDGPLVSREPQLRRLTERVIQAAEGQGGVVLVEGEPGIGKTRLVEEASALAAVQGMTRRLAGEVRITEVGAQVAEGEVGRAILAGRWEDAERWPRRPAAGCRPPACGGRSGANRCSSSPCAASRGASTSCFPACWPAARSRAASR